MNREDIIRMAREAGWSGIYTQWREPDGSPDWTPVKESLTVPVTMEQIECFAALVAAAEREACAKVCEEKQEYSMPIPCPDRISGCLVAHYIPARREKTGSECAAAIRARGQA